MMTSYHVIKLGSNWRD